MKIYISIFVLMILSMGCSIHPKEDSIGKTQNTIKRNHETKDITLQYRISMDATTPSQFVAIYNNGMTLGLKIHWKISKTEKKELDQMLNRLEDKGLNGKEFTVKGRWLHEGYELEIFKIKEKL